MGGKDHRFLLHFKSSFLYYLFLIMGFSHVIKLLYVFLNFLLICFMSIWFLNYPEETQRVEKNTFLTTSADSTNQWFFLLCFQPANKSKQLIAPWNLPAKCWLEVLVGQWQAGKQYQMRNYHSSPGAPLSSKGRWEFFSWPETYCL